MNNILESAKGAWGKLTRPMQIGVSIFVLGVFISLLLLMFFTKTEYQVLFADLNPEDAGAVVTALQERGISYRLAENGSAVLVPQNEVFETRIALATSGLPTGGVVGFEIFNAARLGETEADRQLCFQWALQGELVRTIRQMDEIADARIHIVLPKRSLFVQESQASTASVLLQLKQGRQLKKGQIRAIANLVSTSVEGLTPDNVTIVDTGGNVLNAPSLSEAGGDLLTERFELEWNYEQQLERSIVAMLERIYGLGNVVARVHANLDFDRFEEYSEVFSPSNRGEGLIRSEQRAQEDFQGTSTSAGGVPGVDSNIPGYVFADQVGGSQEYSRSEDTVNYELNRTETRLKITPGQVANLSISVWLNGDFSPAQLSTIEESVSTAIGLKRERGDSIYIASTPFEASPFLMDGMPKEAEPRRPAFWFLAATLALMVLGLIIFLIGRREKAKEAVPPEIDLLVDDDEVALTLSPEEEERLSIRKNIQKLAKEDPEELALLMRTWLVDE